jgi:hypothetical protein
MPFNWLDFLSSRHIDYVTSGSNVSRGNVAIKCPFCGGADEGYHLSISTEGRGWRCFRRPQEHRGKSPLKLVQALAHCTADQAAAIVGIHRPYVSADSMDRVKAMFDKAPVEEKRELTLLPEFKPLFGKGTRLWSARPFINYLERRGFRDQERLKPYKLYYATQGAFKGRIIFPIEYEGELVCWTGRTIYPDVELRYKALSYRELEEGEDRPRAIGPISNYLLWWDELQNIDADTICLCEGPFDALKVDWLGRADGICATCFFTSSPSLQQEQLLHELLPRFRHKFLLLDQETLPQAIRIAAGLQTLGVRSMQLPKGTKDPGELSSLKFLFQGA